MSQQPEAEEGKGKGLGKERRKQSSGEVGGVRRGSKEGSGGSDGNTTGAVPRAVLLTEEELEKRSIIERTKSEWLSRVKVDRNLENLEKRIPKKTYEANAEIPWLEEAKKRRQSRTKSSLAIRDLAFREESTKVQQTRRVDSECGLRDSPKVVEAREILLAEKAQKGTEVEGKESPGGSGNDGAASTSAVRFQDEKEKRSAREKSRTEEVSAREKKEDKEGPGESAFGQENGKDESENEAGRQVPLGADGTAAGKESTGTEKDANSGPSGSSDGAGEEAKPAGVSAEEEGSSAAQCGADSHEEKHEESPSSVVNGTRPNKSDGDVSEAVEKTDSAFKGDKVDPLNITKSLESVAASGDESALASERRSSRSDRKMSINGKGNSKRKKKKRKLVLSTTSAAGTARRSSEQGDEGEASPEPGAEEAAGAEASKVLQSNAPMEPAPESSETPGDPNAAKEVSPPDFSKHTYALDSVVSCQGFIRRYLAMKQLARRKKLLKKRGYVAMEMLKVEKGFLADMELLQEKFIEPFVEQKGAKSDRLRELGEKFTTLKADVQVIVGYERLIEKGLEERKNGDRLGDIFRDIANFLKTYTQYVTDYTKIQSVLAGYKRNVEVQTFIENLRPEGERRGLKDFLIMPVQRIPRLKLMLEELLKSTWREHIDYDPLIESAAKLAEVADYVETAQHKAYARARVIEIAAMLTFSMRQESFQLVTPARLFSKEGQIPSTMPGAHVLRPHKVILFNDLLLFSVERADKRGFLSYRYKSKIYLRDVVQIRQDATLAGTPCVVIEGKGSGQLYKLVPQVQADVQLWLDSLNEAHHEATGLLPGRSDKQDEGGSEGSQGATGGSTPVGKTQSQGRRKFFTLRRKQKSPVPDESAQPSYPPGAARQKSFGGTLTRLRKKMDLNNVYGTIPKKKQEENEDVEIVEEEGAPAEGEQPRRRRPNAKKAEDRLSSLFVVQEFQAKEAGGGESGGKMGASPLSSSEDVGAEQPQRQPQRQRAWKTRAKEQNQDVKVVAGEIEKKYKEIEEKQLVEKPSDNPANSAEATSEPTDNAEAMSAPPPGLSGRKKS
eukprot:CAMPEP_0119124558 /NCGR_PEP_ID=MMETSP1310-20130426/4148_1 /TAXON_ID=464262 /ORGANISM="Genus nov. species nov., Strain RCC2339" /LENGTH=1066 /DNA_ID=CAMNT_0007114535 /DNA_START=108 /DNA_END=3305 /DNA_ORIENTATION=+